MSIAITTGELVLAGSLLAWLVSGGPTARAVGPLRVAPLILVGALAALIVLTNAGDSAPAYLFLLFAAATWLLGIVGLTLDGVVNALGWHKGRQRPHLVRAIFDALAVALLATMAALHWH